MHPPPEKPGGEEWVVNDPQQLVWPFSARQPFCSWNVGRVRTNSWIPPEKPVHQNQPQNQNIKLLHQNQQLSLSQIQNMIQAQNPS